MHQTARRRRGERAAGDAQPLDGKNRMRIAGRLFIGILIVGLALWIAAEMLVGAAVIRIENRSSYDLRSIRLTGNGFDEQIAHLRAGDATCLRPSGIRGESGLEFHAMANNRKIEAKDLAYLESSGGYHVQIDVLPDLRVDASYGSIWLAFCGLAL